MFAIVRSLDDSVARSLDRSIPQSLDDSIARSLDRSIARSLDRLAIPSLIRSITCRTLLQPHPRRPRITDNALIKRRRCYGLLPSFFDSFLPLPSFSISQFLPIRVFLPCLLPSVLPCVRPSVFPCAIPSVLRSFLPLFLDSFRESVRPSSFLPPSFLPCLIPLFRHSFLLAYRPSSLVSRFIRMQHHYICIR